MHLFVGDLLTVTEDPTLFSLLYWVLYSTALDLRQPVGMLDSFLAAHCLYLIIRHPASSMGQKFPRLGRLFPQTKHLFSSKSDLMRSQKSLQERENGGYVVDHWEGMGVGRMRLDMDMYMEMSGGGDFTRPLHC